MYKRILSISLLGATLLSACHSDGGFKKTKNGLEYKIYKDEPGANLKMGDITELNLIVSIHDSVLMDTRKMNSNKPVEVPVQAGNFKWEWLEGLTMLSVGDSAVFLTPVDSIRKAASSQGGLPPWMKNGMKLAYSIKVVGSKTKEEAQKSAMEQAAKQPATDDSLLQAYFKANNITAQKTSSGLYYVIETPGTGDFPKKGNSVTVMYRGKTLDGKTFDTNLEGPHTDPFTFPVGAGQVIPGWDEGIALIKKGGKGHLYIPSGLAYGAQGQGPIPANAVLIFDVEVKDVK